MPVRSKAKLEKEDILAVIDQHGIETVVITLMVGLEETEVFSRTNQCSSRYYSGYYRF